MLRSQPAVIRAGAVGYVLIRLDGIVFSSGLFQTVRTQVSDLSGICVDGAREGDAIQIVTRLDGRRPVAARDIQTQTRKLRVRVGGLSCETLACACDPVDGFIGTVCLAQRVYRVQEGIFRTLAIGESRRILGVARRRLAGAVETQERGRDVIKTIAPRRSLRISFAEPLKNRQRFLVASFLKQSSTDAEISGGDVRIIRIARDERLPVRARFCESAIGLIDCRATHVFGR